MALMHLGLPWRLHIKKSGIEEGGWKLQLPGQVQGSELALSIGAPPC